MKNKNISICFLSIVFLVLQLTCIQALDLTAGTETQGSSQEKVFMAGAAISNISPPLRGEMRGTSPVLYIHDELRARCLVLDDGDTRLAFVVVDLIGMSRDLIDEAKELIQQETGLPVENIMVSASHTHTARGASGSTLFGDYQKFVIQRIADAVGGAIHNLEPARVGWGVGNVPEHVFVRRWLIKPGIPVPNPFGGEDKVRTNPGGVDPEYRLKPAGEPDPEVSFISVQSKDGRPIALLANYSLHYVGGVPTGHISADYFAVFADRIQELLDADRQDPPFVGIMSNGASGDVNNNNYFPNAPRRSFEPYERMRLVAEDVAREVFRVHRTIDHHDWVPLGVAKSELTLQTRKPDRQMIERAEWVLSRPDTVTPVHRRETDYAQRILRMVDSPDEIHIVLQAFRVGDVGIATSPFETFVDIGLELKARSPFKPSFTVSFANGSHGYLPTPEQHELGGYETWLGTNRVEYEASNKLIAKLLELYEMIK